jgi:hypothetical protein
MKVIYMEDTILQLSQIDPQATQELIASGQIKHTEQGKPYLVIQDGDTTIQTEV